MKRDLYAAATEIHRLKAAGGVDTTKAADASTVITEYVAIEPDPEKKLAAQVALADIFEKTGDFTNAVASYRKVLETKPEHPDAMVNLGLSLYMEAVAATPEDKDKEQEALNYLQRYTEVAPITEKDPPSVVAFKKNVKDTVDYLKAQKLTPQKLPAKKRQ